MDGNFNTGNNKVTRSETQNKIPCALLRVYEKKNFRKVRTKCSYSKMSRDSRV